MTRNQDPEPKFLSGGLYTKFNLSGQTYGPDMEIQVLRVIWSFMQHFDIFVPPFFCLSECVEPT